MTKPDIAVFGAGLVGARHVAEAAAQARLCAIVDPAPQARDLAKDYGVPCFSTPQECLAKVTPDGVVIATPNHLHADHALLCLAEGIPVLIEKPIADTAERAARIVAASDASGTPVLIGHHRRHNPIIRRAKALIDADAFGDIAAVTGQFWLYKPDEYFNESWRRAPGAGPLFINLVHDVDLLRHLCGEVENLTALRSNTIRGHDVEDTAALLMRFACGALGTFSLSDTIAAPWSWEMTSAENPIYPHVPGGAYQIGGTRGSLSIPDLTLWQHPGKRSWWEPIAPTRHEVQPADAFAVQFTHFLDVIGGATPLVSAREGQLSLEVVLQTAKAPLG